MNVKKLQEAADNNMGTIRREGSVEVTVGKSQYRIDYLNHAEGIVWQYVRCVGWYPKSKIKFI